MANELATTDTAALENGGGTLQSIPDSFEHFALEELLSVLQGMRAGDFSVRMSPAIPGVFGKIADCLNDIVCANQTIAEELDRVGQVVGREGRIRSRLRLGAGMGAWGKMENSVNALIEDLLWPTSEVTRTIEAVAQGNLLVSMPRRRRTAAAG